MTREERQQIIDAFESTLKKNNQPAIRHYWNSHPLLKTLLSGIPDAPETPASDCVAFDKIRIVFEKSLKAACQEIMSAIWQSCPLLATWYAGKPVTTIWQNGEPMTTKTLTISASIAFFENQILQTQSTDIIKKTWENLPLLADWYSGKPVNFGTVTEPVLKIIDVETFEMAALAALASQTSFIIRIVLDPRLMLSQWFMGKWLATPNSPAPITDIDLYQHFSAVLSSGVPAVAWSMWENNSRLQTLVKQVEDDDIALLLRKMISARHYLLTRDVVDSLTNITPLTNVIIQFKTKYQNKKLPDYIKKPLDYLQQRIDQLTTKTQAATSPAQVLSTLRKTCRKRKEPTPVITIDSTFTNPDANTLESTAFIPSNVAATTPTAPMQTAISSPLNWTSWPPATHLLWQPQDLSPPPPEKEEPTAFIHTQNTDALQVMLPLTPPARLSPFHFFSPGYSSCEDKSPPANLTSLDNDPMLDINDWGPAIQ
jgi:hypothetical protein